MSRSDKVHARQTEKYTKEDYVSDLQADLKQDRRSHFSESRRTGEVETTRKRILKAEILKAEDLHRLGYRWNGQALIHSQLRSGRGKPGCEST